MVLGHTADDQAETLLMRLIRGAGPAGLRGIPPIRDGAIIRPLLAVTRDEILKTLKAADITYVEDRSNRSSAYTRNRIRNRLLPALSAYNPKVKEALCREAVLLRDENDFVAEAARAARNTLRIDRRGDRVMFFVGELHALHPAILRRILWTEIGCLLFNDEAVGFHHIETVRELLYRKGGGTSTLPRAIRAEKRGPFLIVHRTGRECDQNSQAAARQEIRLDIALYPATRVIPLPAWKRRLRVTASGRKPAVLSPCIAAFDFDKLIFPLSVRSRRPGDRFAPSGMGGRSKKLQDYFVDAKIPRAERDSIPLLTSPEGIAWVIGCRVDERFRATETTVRVLTVESEQLKAGQSDQEWKEGFTASR